jgi:hypothetical protein
LATLVVLGDRRGVRGARHRQRGTNGHALVEAELHADAALEADKSPGYWKMFCRLKTIPNFVLGASEAGAGGAGGASD